MTLATRKKRLYFGYSGIAYSFSFTSQNCRQSQREQSLRELIRINQPYLGKEEIDSAVEVLRSGILTDKSGMGPRVLEFERSFAKYAGAKHAVAVVNGT